MPTLNEAFRKSIKAYFNGRETEKMDSLSGDKRKYIKSYFDAIEKEFGLDKIEAQDQDEIDGRKDD